MKRNSSGGSEGSQPPYATSITRIRSGSSAAGTATRKRRLSEEANCTQEFTMSLNGIQKAVERIADALSPGLQFPAPAEGPFEEVLAFYAQGTVELVAKSKKKPYWRLHGELYGLDGTQLVGETSYVSSFPIDPKTLPATFQWPPPQKPPYDDGIIDPKVVAATASAGTAKLAFTFSDGSLLASAGPSVPKIAMLENGGAEFWVSTAAVITNGTGRYEGARGIQTLAGGAYFEKVPDFSDPVSLKPFPLTAVGVARLVPGAKAAAENQ